MEDRKSETDDFEFRLFIDKDIVDGGKLIFDYAKGTPTIKFNLSDYAKKCCEYAVEIIDAFYPQIISPMRGFNNRLVSQRGIFTYCPSPQALDDIVSSIGSFLPPNYNTLLLLKLLIPDELQNEILETLYEMNINHLSLFPDIQGSCEYENWKIERKVSSLKEFVKFDEK